MVTKGWEERGGPASAGSICSRQTSLLALARQRSPVGRASAEPDCTSPPGHAAQRVVHPQQPSRAGQSRRCRTAGFLQQHGEALSSNGPDKPVQRSSPVAPGAAAKAAARARSRSRSRCLGRQRGSWRQGHASALPPPQPPDIGNDLGHNLEMLGRNFRVHIHAVQCARAKGGLATKRNPVIQRHFANTGCHVIHAFCHDARGAPPLSRSYAQCNSVMSWVRHHHRGRRHRRQHPLARPRHTDLPQPRLHLRVAV